MPTIHQPQRPHVSDGLHGLSVLIIDEHHDAADSLADLLRIYGHGIHVAYTSADGLLAEPADVVIVELRMHEMDGWELVRCMQARVVIKQPLFIALTTYGREEDRKRSRDAQIDLHLVKPVEPAVLVGVLKRFARVLAQGVVPPNEGD